jgi:transcriptional regulator with XRE-family HTH domain
VRSRLAKLGYGQKDLARAAQVTESYVSQLLSRRKAPPGRDRTDIYPKMEAFLRLAPGELGRLADIERAEELNRRLGRPPEPMFHHFRDLVLRKCVPERRAQVRQIFDAQPFGLLEQLVARKMLEVVQRVARRELDNDDWIRLAAQVGGRGKEAMRVIVLEFLDMDVFHVSSDSCVHFLDPLVESWDVDVESFRIDITLKGGLVAEPRRSFALVESDPSDRSAEEPGLAEFLQDSRLNDHATEEELRCLRGHRFGERRPNKLYYYRALQNLRDPLHFAGK